MGNEQTWDSFLASEYIFGAFSSIPTEDNRLAFELSASVHLAKYRRVRPNMNSDGLPSAYYVLHGSVNYDVIGIYV